MIARMIRDGLLAAAHDVSDGGALAACAEMCIAGDRGCCVHGPRSAGATHDPTMDDAAFYFAETPGAYLVEPRNDRLDEFLARVRTVPAVRFATVGDEPGGARRFVIESSAPQRPGVVLTLEELRSAWQWIG